MLDVASIIKLCRKKSGMDIYDLAKKSGVAYSTIVNIEKGYGRPNLNTLEYILEAMGFELEILPKEERYER